jgi:hypothetical protein
MALNVPVRFKAKYLWYFVVLAGSIVSFFGLYDLPKTWGAVRQILLNPLEGWLQTNAADPILTAFILGLAFGTIILPEIWSYAKPRLFPPESDISAANAYKTILEGSKLAKELTSNWRSLPGLPYEISKPVRFGQLE